MPVLRLNSVRGVLIVDTLIEEAEFTDRAATFVGQKLEGHSVPISEATENLNGVVTDRKDGDPLPLEVRDTALQLNELRSTERSPVGTAIEHHERALPTTAGVEVNGPAMLVWQHDVWKAGSHRRSDGVKVDDWQAGKLACHGALRSPG